MKLFCLCILQLENRSPNFYTEIGKVIFKPIQQNVFEIDSTILQTRLYLWKIYGVYQNVWENWKLNLLFSLEFEFKSPNWEMCRIYNEFTTKTNEVLLFLMEMKESKPSVNSA